MPRLERNLQVLTVDDGSTMSRSVHSVSSGSGFGSPVHILPSEGFGGARMKMDELFVFWLSQRDTNRMLRTYLDAIASGAAVDEPTSAALLSAFGSVSSSSLSPRSLSPHKAGVGPFQVQLPPPRSPTAKTSYWPAAAGPAVGGVGTPPGAAGAAAGPAGPAHGAVGSAGTGTRTERFERFLSPEKRVERSPSRASSTYSDDSTAPRAADHAAAATTLAAAAAAAAAGHRLPTFYCPGEGGRGQGRQLPLDRLEVRLPEIEELFRPHPNGLAVEDFV
ncbi:unnamed protein product, partial [Phaeothamnion confervicola]